MEKEPPDKLACLEHHGFLAVIVCIIPPSERDFTFPDAEDAVIADCSPVSISAKVLKNTFGAIEGWFAIDDPFLAVELSHEGVEVDGISEMTDAAGKDKSTSFEVIFEEVKELAAEQRRHDLYVNKESFAA
jgi:hypothetical protein